MAAPSPRGSLGRRTVCGRTEQRRPPASKRTKVRLDWYEGVFLLLQQRSKHPREMVITPKASTSLLLQAALHGRVLVLEGLEKAERNILPNIYPDACT